MSIVDGSLNLVNVCELDQQLHQELMVENPGLTLLGLKRRSENYLVTSTSGERFDDVETPAVSPPVAYTDDQLSEIASSIPAVAVDPEVLKLRNSAVLVQ